MFLIYGIIQVNRYNEGPEYSSFRIYNFFEIVGVGDPYLYRELEVTSLNLDSIIHLLF